MKSWFSRLTTSRQPDTVASQPRLFSDGHFYSPIADLDDIKAREDAIWSSAKVLAGIEWREDSQLRLLQDFLGYVPEIDFPVEKPNNPTTYFYMNDQFPVLDAEVLYCMLRHFKPHRMIEVGSGFSSLVTAHVNRVHLGGGLQFACIEPYGMVIWVACDRGSDTWGFGSVSSYARPGFAQTIRGKAGKNYRVDQLQHLFVAFAGNFFYENLFHPSRSGGCATFSVYAD